ncbi:MAG TPA: hypothetical protein VMQ93_08770, partial [Novosphingobium sp.]|nr:hypothetical protein [Novosphingobium sp.]
STSPACPRWTRSPPSPYVAALGQTASQATWGWIAFTAGALHLSALYVNGTRRRSPHLRAACSGVGTLFWFQVCLGIYGTGLINTGMAIYPWLAVFSARNVMAAMRDARRSDDQFKSEVDTGGRR